MPYSSDKMKTKIPIKFEDILFWILILAIVAIIIWKLHGSPTDTGTIVGIGTFLISSEALIWKAIFNNDKKTSLKLFEMDKKTAISFIKIKNEMNNRFDKIEDKLNIINNKIKK